MALKIPKEFECPITLDVITDPVRTNCNDEKHLGFFTRFFSKNLPSNGHAFDKWALADYIRRNLENPKCLVCNKKITKAVADKKLAQKITKEFTNLSDKHKKHFKAAKKAILLNYFHMRNHLVFPNDQSKKFKDSSFFIETSQNNKTVKSTFKNNAYYLLFDHKSLSYRFEFFSRDQKKQSNNLKYNKVLQYISKNYLNFAENEADKMICSRYRDKSYFAISEKYFELYSSIYKAKSSFRYLQKAIDVSVKIMDHQMKNNLYYKIVQKMISCNYLAQGQKIALLISDKNKRNEALNDITEKYFTNYSYNRNEIAIQNAIKIANTLITDSLIKQKLLNQAVNEYINAFKLKKALNLNNSILSTKAKDQNKKNIAIHYVNRNFNKDFQKALTAASQIFYIPTKDTTYRDIAEITISNKAYLKSFKIISKLSKFTNRLALYVKLSCKILIFALFKIITAPFSFFKNSFLQNYLKL